MAHGSQQLDTEWESVWRLGNERAPHLKNVTVLQLCLLKNKLTISQLCYYASIHMFILLRQSCWSFCMMLHRATSTKVSLLEKKASGVTLGFRGYIKLKPFWLLHSMHHMSTKHLQLLHDLSDLYQFASTVKTLQQYSTYLTYTLSLSSQYHQNQHALIC